MDENELEKVSGGRNSGDESINLCLYCAYCGFMLIHGLSDERYDIIEEQIHYFEQHLSCGPGQTPRIHVGIYHGEG